MHIKNAIDRHLIVMSAFIFLYVKPIKDIKNKTWKNKFQVKSSLVKWLEQKLFLWSEIELFDYR